ncbi:MAG: O-antigen ligase family protein [Pseudonocardiaceae bacterium]
MDSGPAQVLLLWSALAAIAAVGAVWPPLNRTNYPVGNTVAGLDNYALPLAVILIVWFWSQLVSTRAIATVVSRVIVTAMLANAVISIVALFAGSYDATPWVKAFWMRGDEGGTAIATLALTNGRYTGIFNQPAEAGICYSLSLFCLFYLTQVAKRPRTGCLALGGVLLAVGGVLTVSKVFLLCGLPLILFMVLRDRRGRIAFAFVLVSILAIYQGLRQSELLRNWYALPAIQALLDPTQASTSTLTAGRLGSGGTLAYVGDQVLEHNRWFGLGAGGVQASYDSTWLEAIVTTGVVGTALIVAVLLALAVRWYRARGVQLRPEWTLAGATLVLAVGASLGMPSLTGNRVSTVTWLLLSCLVLAHRQPGKQSVIP